MLQRLLTPVDRVPFSAVWIGVRRILVAGGVLPFPNRFGNTINRVSHPALGHKATIRSDCTVGHLAVHPRATTTARIHHVIEPTVEREARVKDMVIKESTPTVTMCIKGSISTSMPRVGEEWVGHGVVKPPEDGAEDGLKDSERVGEPGVVPPKVKEGVFGKGCVALRAGIAGATTMT